MPHRLKGGEESGGSSEICEQWKIGQRCKALSKIRMERGRYARGYYGLQFLQSPWNKEFRRTVSATWARQWTQKLNYCLCRRPGGQRIDVFVPSRFAQDIARHDETTNEGNTNRLFRAHDPSHAPQILARMDYKIFSILAQSTPRSIINGPLCRKPRLPVTEVHIHCSRFLLGKSPSGVRCASSSQLERIKLLGK